MAFNIGLNVIETEGRSSPAIAGASTSIAGVVIRARRGPIDKAIRISNFQQFIRRFGTYHPDYMGAYCINGFFLNGGREAYVTRVLGSTDSNEPAAAFADIAPTSFRLTAGFRGQEDVGTWGDEISVDIGNIATSASSFDLVVKLQGRVVETWEGLTLNNIEATLNDTFSGSTYVLVNPESVGTVLPQEQTDTPLTGGSDGSEPQPSDYTDSLNTFNTIQIQLLAIPDGAAADVTSAALDYCANETIKGDCMYIGHTPPGRDVEGAKTFGSGFRRAKVFGALYWPNIDVIDPIGAGSNPIKRIPPVGHVMGVFARIDQTRGAWKAPAGNGAVVRGALAVEQDITDIDHTDLVKNGSVNGIRSLPGVGIVIDASRTLSTDSRWLYVNVRLLFNYVKASLREGLRWVKQEPNRETLWNKIKYNVVTPFLQGLYQAGAFGPGTPEQVFTVICGP